MHTNDLLPPACQPVCRGSAHLAQIWYIVVAYRRTPNPSEGWEQVVAGRRAWWAGGRPFSDCWQLLLLASHQSAHLASARRGCRLRHAIGSLQHTHSHLHDTISPILTPYRMAILPPLRNWMALRRYRQLLVPVEGRPPSQTGRAGSLWSTPPGRLGGRPFGQRASKPAKPQPAGPSLTHVGH